LAAPQDSFRNSPRVHESIRAGNLYLSLQDALALAIENNLDIELERSALPAADAELLRAKGGGTLRGLSFTLAEAPAGVGGTLSPVVTSAAIAGRATSGSSVATNAIELGVLAAPQSNLSMQGGIPQSGGTVVPGYDPAVVGLLNWTHQTTPEVSIQRRNPAGFLHRRAGRPELRQHSPVGECSNLRLHSVYRLELRIDGDTTAAARFRNGPQPPLHPHCRK
jgi:hypothetical protein